MGCIQPEQRTGRLLEYQPVNIEDSIPLPRLVGIEDAMRQTTLGRSAIYNLINAGELRRIKLGKKVVFLEQDLRDFIERKVAEAHQPKAA